MLCATWRACAQWVLGVRPRPGLHLDLDPPPEAASALLTSSATATGNATPSSGAGSTALHDLSPAEAYAAMCLLGDLMPPEWPPQGPAALVTPAPAAGGKPSSGAQPMLAAPAAPARRAALLGALTSCEAQLRRLLAFGAVCEARPMRHATLRLVAAAAGLGPRMPSFCVQPLLEPLTVSALQAAPRHAPIVSAHLTPFLAVV